MVASHWRLGGFYDECVYLLKSVQERDRQNGVTYSYERAVTDGNSNAIFLKKLEMIRQCRLSGGNACEHGSVVDVGANIGSCTMLFGSLGFNVLAVEASPLNFKYTNASITASRMERYAKVIFGAASFETKEKSIEHWKDESSSGGVVASMQMPLSLYEDVNSETYKKTMKKYDYDKDAINQ